MDYTIQYYDLVLAIVGGCLAVGWIVGAFTAVATTVAVPVMGLLAILVIGHGLFVNGPVESPRDLTDEVDVLN